MKVVFAQYLIIICKFFNTRL